MGTIGTWGRGKGISLWLPSEAPGHAYTREEGMVGAGAQQQKVEE